MQISADKKFQENRRGRVNSRDHSPLTLYETLTDGMYGFSVEFVCIFKSTFGVFKCITIER